MANLLNFSDVFNVVKYPSGERTLHLDKDGRSLLYTKSMILVNERTPDWNLISDVIMGDEILKRNGYDSVDWLIPFFPFARDDRPINSLYANPLITAISMLEHRGVSVVTLDPHSDVLAGRVNHYAQNSIVHHFIDEREVLGLSPYTHIVVPDAGALKKASTWLHYFGGVEVILASKVRNPVDGKLSNIDLALPYRTINDFSSFLIVDDICDGGGTFVGLRDKLPALAKVDLLVTHGLFTNPSNYEELHRYRKIWSFDHIGDAGPNNLTRLPLRDFLHTNYTYERR